MKKILSVVIVLILTLSLFAGCGQSEEKEKHQAERGEIVHTDVEKLETIGDVLALGAYSPGYAVHEEYFVYACELNGDTYRILCPIEKSVSQSIFDLEYDDEKYDEKLEAIISPLKIERRDNLNKFLPSKEETDSYIGKTAQELFDDGWYESGWNLDEMEFSMNKGFLLYTMIFEGTVEDPDNFETEDMGPLVVKSVKSVSVGDATHLDFDENGKLIKDIAMQ